MKEQKGAGQRRSGGTAERLDRRPQLLAANPLTDGAKSHFSDDQALR